MTASQHSSPLAATGTGAHHRLTIPSDLAEETKVREWVGDIATRASLPSDRIFDLQVVVSEAVANAIEHAASGVELEAWVLPDRLVVEVTNDGVFRPGIYEDGDGRRRGLGLPLMVSLADHVHVARLTTGRTKVSLTFFLADTGREAGVLSFGGSGPADESDRHMQSRLGRWTWLPIPLIVILALVFHLLGLHVVHESQSLLATFNSLFVAGPLLVIAYLAARSYVVSARPSLVPLGAGSLVIGIAYLLAGPLITIPNHAITVFSGAILAGAACFVLSAFQNARTNRPLKPRRTLVIALVYAAVIGFLGLVLILTYAGVVPAFFIQGPGYTTVRVAVFGLGVAALLLAAAGFFVSHRRVQSRFVLYWYSGLALLGVAFAISLVSGAPSGNPVSWLQRGGQWLAGLYLLAGLLSLTAGRERAPFALERALEESEDRYRKLIDTNPDAILVVADGKVAFANPASAALLGAGSPLELRGTEWLSFVHVDCRRLMDEGGASTLSGSLLPLQDVALVRLDGRVRDAEVTASRIELEGRLAMQFLLRDVSERKRAERAREQLVVDQQQLNEELAAVNQELQAQTEELAVRGEELRTSYERQSETAKEQQVLFDRLQRVFLDKLPDLPEVEFAYTHVSATTGSQVGGDFYDLFYIDDDSLSLMIGDVSGQGIEASRIALMVKDSIRAFALEEPKPGKVVERVNRLLTKRGLPGFVTAFFGILDLRTGDLASASAGHPPPFVSLSGEVSQLEVAPALPLGVFPDAVYHERHAVLPNQALLLLYTDGLTEARRDSGMYGEGRLRLMLSRTALLPLSQVPHLLVEDALTFADGRVTDDAAVLLLRYKACR